MSQKPPAKPEKSKPRSLSDSDIVSKTSLGRASAGRANDTDKGAKASDRDAASDSDKHAPHTPPQPQAGKDKDSDRD